MSASASMFNSCSFTHQFKLNYLETENVAIGHSVSSEDISAGGHLWRFVCYPRGTLRSHNGEYLSIFLQHESKSTDVKAIFEASVVDRDGTLFSSERNTKFSGSRSVNSSLQGWPRFVKRSVLESLYVTNGFFIIMCGVKVVHDEDRLELEVPPSDIGSHLGLLLDSAEGSDVSFVVGGEKFPAHRAVLAARSPVFKAQLLGSMAEASMSSITLHDIAPATFRVMLRFMYTDAFPMWVIEDDDDAELGDCYYSDEMFRHLIAAADRFALDRLKLLCAAELWDHISVDTVAATLICAETYNCPQLKHKCVDFIAEEKNFKKAVLTDGFVQLAQQFPAILDELREKVGA